MAFEGDAFIRVYCNAGARGEESPRGPTLGHRSIELLVYERGR